VIFDVAHQIGLIPIALLLLLRRNASRPLWLVAFAFAISWIGDSVSHYTGGSWAPTYFWLPLQFALVLWAVLPKEGRLMWMAVLLFTTALSWLLTGPSPEWLVSVLASVVVLVYAREQMAIPLWIYFGAGTAAYCWMIASIGDGDIMAQWYLYQSCRLLAFIAFGWIALSRPHVAVDD
jgi:hypothetical protein